MKHTKGPWRKAGNVIWGAEPQKKIAHISPLMRENGDSMALEEAANAQLIAAAPEMLKALMVTIDWLEKHGARINSELDPNREIFDQILFAILKASGGAK